MQLRGADASTTLLHAPLSRCSADQNDFDRDWWVKMIFGPDRALLCFVEGWLRSAGCGDWASDIYLCTSPFLIVLGSDVGLVGGTGSQVVI